MHEEPKMKSIWYFVGLMLTVMGLIVSGSGVYYLVFPTGTSTVLGHLHPNIWWGVIMLVSGLLFYIFNRRKFVE